MIIGNGLLAKVFQNEFLDDQNVLIFASGVSNSQSENFNEFLREKKLIESNLKECKKFIYFSTCSVDDPFNRLSKYVQHKLEMENLIKQSSSNFIIARLPQIAGKTDNPFTLLNYLFHKIKKDELFNVYEGAVRNIIDVDDVQKILSNIIQNNLFDNSIINVASPIYSPILDIISIFEKILCKKAIFNLVRSDSNYYINNNLAINFEKCVDINFDANYLERTLYKYYAK